MGITSSQYDEERLLGFQIEVRSILVQIQELRYTRVENAAEKRVNRKKLRMLEHRFRTLNCDNYDLNSNGPKTATTPAYIVDSKKKNK